MSMRLCPACFHFVSDTAKACPKCGAELSAEIFAKNKGKTDRATFVGLIIAVGIGLFMYYVMASFNQQVIRKMAAPTQELNQSLKELEIAGKELDTALKNARR